MSWEISIPFRTRDDSLAEVLDAARELPPEDRGVARRVVLDAATQGDRSAGDVLDRLEAATPAERREILDRAREAEGLKRSAAIDAEPIRHPAGNEGLRLQACHAEGCSAYPLDPAGGWARSDARRWHCPEHKHLAADGDMDPTPERYVLDHNLQLRPVGEERERIKREEAERLAAEAERNRQQEAELEAIRKARQRFADDDEAITTVMDFHVRPDGRIVRD